MVTVKDERQKCGNRKGEVNDYNLYKLGVRGTNFKTRTIQECLNCKRHHCTGCPKGEPD